MSPENVVVNIRSLNFNYAILYNDDIYYSFSNLPSEHSQAIITDARNIVCIDWDCIIDMNVLIEYKKEMYAR